MSLQKSRFQLLLLRHVMSQGSVVTHLRCDGIFSVSIIANFLLIPTATFENRSIFDTVKAYDVEAFKKVSVFWATL